MFEAIAALEGRKITCSDSIRITVSRANTLRARPKIPFDLSNIQYRGDEVAE
jgi:hypothetical protein